MPYLIFDLEMTGTESDFHDIIQIGAIPFELNKIKAITSKSNYL